LLIVAGATGVSIWRILKNLVTLKNSNISYTIEKIFAFKKADEWVVKMQYEVESKRIYALLDRSVQVYSLGNKTSYTKLENIHESPVTKIIWSRRNQFYVTACSGGLVKCWTSYLAQVGDEKVPPKLEITTSADIYFESDGGGMFIITYVLFLIII
jgi:WD40 repeat protein